MRAAPPFFADVAKDASVAPCVPHKMLGLLQPESLRATAGLAGDEALPNNEVEPALAETGMRVPELLGLRIAPAIALFLGVLGLPRALTPVKLLLPAAAWDDEAGRKLKGGDRTGLPAAATRGLRTLEAVPGA